MSKLAKRDDVVARAVAYTILTNARSGEVRGMTCGEIDSKNAMWVVPASRMTAYARGDLLAKRRALMEDWTAYAMGTTGTVVLIRSGRKRAS